MKRPLSALVVRAAMHLIAAVCRLPDGRKAIERTPLRGGESARRFEAASAPRGGL